MKYKLLAVWSILIGRGAVVPKSFKRNDFMTGDVSISTTSRYTIISVNGRDFYFTPDTQFDGTGFSCCGSRTVESPAAPLVENPHSV